MSKCKVYLAAPFFNKEQLDLVTQLEIAIIEEKWEMFSPRLGQNATRMNAILSGKGKPPADLREAVFHDNWSNIDDADLLIAVIDNFDVGVMWEVGYAFARHVPIVTFTAKNYGCNLMLAHSIIAHAKSIDTVRHVLQIGSPHLKMGSDVMKYGEVIALIQSQYKTEFSLKEGPDERNQAGLRSHDGGKAS